MKKSFFDKKIQKIASKNKKPWNLINQIKKQKLPAIKALQFNEQLYIELEDIW